MGLFSSKRTVATSSTSLLIEEDYDDIKEAIIMAVYNDYDIADSVINALLDGMNIKAEQYYRYGRDNYTYGLPDGAYSYIPASDTAIELVIQELVGSPVYLSNIILDSANPERHIMPTLIADYGYDTLTHEIYDAPISFDAEAFSEEYPVATRYGKYEAPEVVSEPFLYSADSNEVGYITITIGYRVRYLTSTKKESNSGNSTVTIFTYKTATATEELRLAVPDYDPDKVYYYVMYNTLNETLTLSDETFYWTYDTTKNLYPTLVPDTGYTETSAYYPIVPVRFGGQDLTAESFRDTDLYKTSARTLRFLGIDLKDLGKTLNENDEINNVESLYIMMGVSIDTESKEGITYLYDFFEDLELRSTFNKQDFDYWQKYLGASAPPMNKYEVKDYGYQMILGYHYITKELLVGTIADGAKEGDTTISYNIQPRAVVNYIYKTYDSSETRELYSYETSELILRKQVSDTQYYELRVFGPYHLNKISGDLIDLSEVTSSTKEFLIMETTLEDALNEDASDNFIIPLNRNLAKQQGFMRYKKVIFASLRMVVNTKYTYKLKWYQTGFFKFLVIVIAVVIAIYSGGTSLGFLSSLYASAGIIGIAVWVGLNLAIAYGFKIAIKEIGKKFGIEVAIFVALLASLASGFSNTTLLSGSVLGAPFAIDFLMIANSITAGINEYMEELSNDLTNDTEEYEEKLAELLATEDDGLLFDVLDLLEIDIDGDTPTSTTSNYDLMSPDEYYNIAIHTGNVGTYSIDAIEYYTSNQLDLDNV